MEFLIKIRTFIQELDEKEFQTYLIATLAGIFLVLIFFMAFYMKRVNTLKKQIAYVNEKREEVKEILEKNENIDAQKQQVDTLLEKEKDFKIGQYFQDILNKFSLGTQSTVTSPVDKNTTYREIVLKATFDAMTMKQLCDLLEEIEKNKSLVYTKDLEITRSKRQARTIEVILTIATLQKKSHQTELAE